MGNGKFSQSVTTYLLAAVHVLATNIMISNFNQGDIFQIMSNHSDKKIL